jgi:phosphoribosylformylglycinamidine synthase
VHLKVTTANSPFTREVPEGMVLRVPIAHGEGCYFADDETLARLRVNDQILFQYATEAGELTDEANPNGSLLNIAGICNDGRNVCGMMPHPERASENILGGDDGRLVFDGMLRHLEARAGLGQAAVAEA